MTEYNDADAFIAFCSEHDLNPTGERAQVEWGEHVDGLNAELTGPSCEQQLDMLRQQLAAAQRLLAMVPPDQLRCYQLVDDVGRTGFVPIDTWVLKRSYIDDIGDHRGPSCSWAQRTQHWHPGKTHGERLQVFLPKHDGDPYTAVLVFWASPDDGILSRVEATATDGVPEVLGAVGSKMVNAKLTAVTVPENKRRLDGTPR